MKKLLTLFTTILMLVQANARPVHNNVVILKQKDGSLIKAIVNGDEFNHTVKDLEGHRLVKDSEGNWCYAAYTPDGYAVSSGYCVGEKVPSNILAGSMITPLLRIAADDRRKLRDSRDEEKGSLIRRIMAPRKTTSGSNDGPVRKHCMILLVDFKDKKMTYSREDFVKLITQHGYNLYGACGSVNDYFDDQFRGDMEFSYEISDIITLDNDCAWYFANDNGEDRRADNAVAEACLKASAAGIDFSSCDDDGDGEVDNVFLFVAGQDEADNADEDCVWSHMNYLELSGNSSFSNLVIDGKKINNYAISTEFRKLSDGSYAFTSIGTFCHEYSHALGLKDLYDTDFAGSGGYGDGLWYTTGLMDGGNGNNDFNTPPNYNAIDLYLSGIGNPEELEPGSYTLEPISENRRFLKMETGNPGEFFLIECRDNKGWDKYIGGKGLLIYHIDQSRNMAGRSDKLNTTINAAARWRYNEVNCVPSRQCARLVPATSGINAFTSNGILNGNTSSVFFPSASSDSFTATSDPAFIFWDGSASPLAITSIRMSGDDVCFDVVRIEHSLVPEVLLDRSEVFQDSAVIQWRSDNPDYTGEAYVTWGSGSDEQTVVEVSPYEKGKYAIVLEGLSPATAYNVSILFKGNGLVSKEADAGFTTKMMYDGYPFIYLNNIDRNEDGTFGIGTMVPLRLFNADRVKSVEWYMGNTRISIGADGYYHLNSSGRLKAVITRKDNTKETLMKEIRIK